MIPRIDHNLRRQLAQNSISRDPTPATLRRAGGSDYIAIELRLGNPSQSRKVAIAGVHEEIPDIEAKLVLDTGQAKPEAMRDIIAISGVDYRIIEVTQIAGANCFLLTLTKEN